MRELSKELKTKRTPPVNVMGYDQEMGFYRFPSGLHWDYFSVSRSARPVTVVVT